MPRSGVGRGLQVQVHLVQETLDLGVIDGAAAGVDGLHPIGVDVEGPDLVTLGQQYRIGQSHVSHPGHCDLHALRIWTAAYTL